MRNKDHHQLRLDFMPRNPLLHLLLIFHVILSLSTLQAQDSIQYNKDKKILSLVDTLFIDRDVNHWSVRIFTNYKDNKFKLSNNDNTLSYTPNNSTGIGIGFATSKIILDFSANIKSNEEQATDRFDLQGNILIKQNLLIVQLQNYKGFNITNTSIDDSRVFRQDIRSFSTSLSFLHIFKPEINTLSALYSGLHKKNENGGSLLAGIYSSYHKIDADSSIVPESSREYFNEEAQIEAFRKFAIGGSFGYAYFLNLPANMFLLVALTPGVGLNFSNINTESGTYNASNNIEFYLYANIAIGYNGPKFYIELSDRNIWSFSSINYGNKGSMNSTNFKLAIGWKIRNH